MIENKDEVFEASLTVLLPEVIGPKDPTTSEGKNPDPSKYWTVTFKSADDTKGTVAAENTFYVLKSANKTLADLEKVAPATTAKDGYTFDKWDPALDKNTAIDKDMNVTAQFVDSMVGPKDPTKDDGKNPDSSKYWTVTFESADTTKGTVDAKNTVYVLKSANKTLADIKDSAPVTKAKEGYKFDKWEPALDNNTAINKDITVTASFKQADQPASDDNNPQAATATAVPQTGDSANGLLYAAFMGLPGVSLLAAGLRKRRKQH